MKLKVPKAIIHGHANIILELNEVLAVGGEIAEKAKQLRDAMVPHFKKEEEYALPPLGLLLAFTDEKWEINAEEAIKMAENLELRLAEMKNDHSDIIDVLNQLKSLGEKEHNYIVKMFVKTVALHIEMEDEVLYPATLLVGNYLKKIAKS